MLNFSVPIRLPFMKIPKLPESHTLLPAFLSFWSLAPRERVVAAIAPRTTNLLTNFIFALPPACRRENLFNFLCDLLYVSAQGFHTKLGLFVGLTARGKQLGKPRLLFRQRANSIFTRTTPAQLLKRCFEQNRCPCCSLNCGTILFSYKRATAQSNHQMVSLIAALQQGRKRCTLGPPKLRLAGFSENRG